MYPGNSSNYGYYAQLKKVAIEKSKSNKLKIIKLNNILYYFINDMYVYQTESAIHGAGRNFGFIAPAFSTLYIDNFKIGIMNSNLIISKVSPTITISTQIFKINSDTHTLTK
jgi:hypothetical protein